MRFLRLLGLCFVHFSFWIGPTYAQEVSDSSTAFFEGDSHTYTITPPNGYSLLINEARQDGYSFAFVRDGQKYQHADIIMLATYMALNAEAVANFSLPRFIRDDTAQMRTYFGKKLSINTVDGVTNFGGDTLATIYLNDPDEFIPTVMVSYFFLPNELFIFELVISETFPRFKAEEVFLECLLGFKVLKKGDIRNLSAKE